MTDQIPTPTPAEQPVPAPAQAAPAYAAAPAASTAPWNVLGIVSLIVSIVGFGWISLVAVILGHLSLSQIKRTNEQGHGLALAGTIIGYVGILFSIIGGIIAIIYFIALASYANQY